MNLEWIGWVALVILLIYSSYPGKVRKLERKMARMEQKREGVDTMSKIIMELVGKTCMLKLDETLELTGKSEIQCTVLEADGEWIKITYADKKDVVKTKILRIDAISSVELLGE